MIFQEKITIATTGRGFIHITPQINKLVKQAKIKQGLCHLFIQHTSASLIITENADTSVKTDLEMIIQRLAPDGDAAYTHTFEGEDDMSAHIRSMLTDTSLSIPINDHQLALGTWQGIYLWEHRYCAHQRQIICSIIA